jgi:hypothetical protein
MPDKNEYVTLRELSKMLNMDTSNARKYGKKMGFVFTKIRTPESRGQLTLALTRKDAETLCELRERQGFTGKKISDANITNGEGYFYIIQLIPDLKPNRVKLGFATDVDARLQAHRTSAPTAIIVKYWPCKKTWECAAIASITRIGCISLSNEVFDCDNLDSLIERAELFFSIMPSF